MNIFATSEDPVRSAVALDNKRIGKMLIESNQIISTALLLSDDTWKNHIGPGQLSRPTHIHHPIVKWACNHDNMNWLLSHAFALASEFEYRFKKQHGSFQRTLYISKQLNFSSNFSKIKFCNCARNTSHAIDYSNVEDVHTAYKLYLCKRWDNETPKWTGRHSPLWY